MGLPPGDRQWTTHGDGSPGGPPLLTLRRTLALLALVAVLGYLVWANARWKEQAQVAIARADVAQRQVDSLGVRWRLTADSADVFRNDARVAERRAATVTGHLQSLRVRYDSLVEHPVTLADTVIVTQDSVIAVQDTVIRSLRLEASALRAGAHLLQLQRDVLQGERDSLLVLVRRAPVVQFTAPKPRSGWLVAGGLVVGYLMGVL